MAIVLLSGAFAKQTTGQAGSSISTTFGQCVLPKLLCELEWLAHHTLLGVIVPHLHKSSMHTVRCETQPANVGAINTAASVSHPPPGILLGITPLNLFAALRTNESMQTLQQQACQASSSCC
jgi:hypothetical protein